MYYLLSIIILFFSPQTFSQYDVTVGLSHSPPYVNQNTGDGAISSILDHIYGQKVNKLYLPFGRGRRLVSSGELDAYTHAPPIIENPSLSSVPYMYYQAAAICLAPECGVESIADLSNKVVASFQGATSYFGQEYAQIVKQCPYYHEAANLKVLVDMLRAKRVDIVIVSHDVFRSLWAELNLDVNLLNITPIMAPIPTRMLFSNASLRNEFDIKFMALVNSGLYKDILSQYLSQELVEYTDSEVKARAGRSLE